MDVVGLLQLLRRRAAAIILCLLVGVLTAVVVTQRSTKVYEAEATVFISVPVADSAQAGVVGVQLTSNLLPSYAKIATSRATATQVRSSLGLQDSVASLRARITATPFPDTLLISIKATDPDPVRAQSIANAVTIALRENVEALESGRRAEARVQVSVIDSANARRTPIKPDPGFNYALGLTLGLAVGLAVALLWEALDRTVKTPAQAQHAAGAPVLGLVPRFRRGLSGVVTLEGGDDRASEAFRTFRTSVRFVDPDDTLAVLLVTSPHPGEGKTTTAVNLAVTLALGGDRVVLVDADLRRATLGEYLGLESAVGLTTVVTRQAALEDALQTWHDLLTVLPSGSLPPNPSELLGSQSMERVLQELHDAFDVVIIDAPPVLPVTDAVVLATQADGVLVVCRAGKTQRQLLVEARRRLDTVGARVLGVLLNAVDSSTVEGYYANYQPVDTQGRGRRR